MQHFEHMLLEMKIVDDGTLDRVVEVRNAWTNRATLYRFDADAYDATESMDAARDQYLEELAEFLAHHSNF